MPVWHVRDHSTASIDIVVYDVTDLAGRREVTEALSLQDEEKEERRAYITEVL